MQTLYGVQGSLFHQKAVARLSLIPKSLTNGIRKRQRSLDLPWFAYSASVAWVSWKKWCPMIARVMALLKWRRWWLRDSTKNFQYSPR